MFNINRNIISKVVVFILAIIVLPLIGNYFYNSKQKISVSVSKSIELQLSDFLEELASMWQGTRSAKNIEKCNIDFLRKKILNRKWDNFTVSKNITDFADHIKLSVFFKTYGKYFDVKFYKDCNDRYLPKNMYMASNKQNDELKWDNYLLDIFIDKFYVSKNDVYLWQKRNKYKLTPQFKNDYEAVVNFPLSKMKKFCNEHGKQLLESRYFDAATFFPSTGKNIFNHPFPWTKSHKSFLTMKDSLTKENCKSSYVLGCEKLFDFSNWSDHSISWIGISHALGGHAEAFRNTYEPLGNLKVSNMKLKKKSLWHQLGYRGHLKERERFEPSEVYSHRMIPIEMDLEEVAFRCMSLK